MLAIDDLKEQIIRVVESRPGIRLERLSEVLGVGRYEVYRAVKELVKSDLIELREGEEYDFYRPTWTKSLFVKKRLRLKKVETTGREISSLEEGRLIKAPKLSSSLILTHPSPFKASLDYITFHECFEVLASQKEVLGIIGYVDSYALRDFLGSIAQRIKAPFSVKLVVRKVSHSDSLREVQERLQKLGVNLEIRIPKWQSRQAGIHAKFLVGGTFSYVGSHNFLPTSLSTNLEVGVLIQDKELAELLKRIFWEAWGSF